MSRPPRKQPSGFPWPQIAVNQRDKSTPAPGGRGALPGPGGELQPVRRSRGTSSGPGVPAQRETQEGDRQNGPKHRHENRKEERDPGSHSETTSHSGEEPGKNPEEPHDEEAGLGAADSHHSLRVAVGDALTPVSPRPRMLGSDRCLCVRMGPGAILWLLQHPPRSSRSDDCCLTSNARTVGVVPFLTQVFTALGGAFATVGAFLGAVVNGHVSCTPSTMVTPSVCTTWGGLREVTRPEGVAGFQGAWEASLMATGACFGALVGLGAFLAYEAVKAGPSE